MPSDTLRPDTNRSIRLVSHSEAASLLDCQAKHDFAYVGRLAGSALAPKQTPLLLREGRAWGIAVALFHSGIASRSVDELHDEVQRAVRASLEKDAEQQRAAGVYLPDEHRESEARLLEMLAHYIGLTVGDPLPITRLEHELLVAAPARTGQRKSSRYRFLARLDGVHEDEHGRTWIVEFKLRRQLSSFDQIVLSRQIRWYAWAWRETTGVEPTGVIVDERLNAVPSAVRINKDGRPSARQSCRPEAYVAAGGSDEQVLEGLRQKCWQARHPILLRPEEIDEAGQQITSVARQIQAFDAGHLYPVRNPSQMRCPSCAFREVCPTPGDTELVDALYVRKPAKRDREEMAA